jgi:hypothetical protein
LFLGRKTISTFGAKVTNRANPIFGDFDQFSAKLPKMTSVFGGKLSF